MTLDERAVQLLEDLRNADALELLGESTPRLLEIIADAFRTVEEEAARLLAAGDEDVCAECRLPVSEEGRQAVYMAGGLVGRRITFWRCQECGYEAWDRGQEVREKMLRPAPGMATGVAESTLGAALAGEAEERAL